MIRSGIVVHVDHSSGTGVIEDQNGRDWFFSKFECKNQELPNLRDVVTFAKDPDFKSTNVACAVELSLRYLKLLGRYAKAA